MKRQRILIAVALALVVAIGLRIRTLGRLPQFVPGLPETRPPSVRMERVEMDFAATDGVLSVRAFELGPGHESFGGLRLGPATFFHLRVVEIALRKDSDKAWTIRSGEARLRSRRLEFGRDAFRVGADGATEAVAADFVDLRTGRLRTR